jgi:hypothetical protein
VDSQQNSAVTIGSTNALATDWRDKRIARTLATRLGASMLWCSLCAGCSQFGEGMPSYSDRILLGTAEEIELPKNRRRLDDYTCGTRTMICEDHITTLRCSCSQSAGGEFR